LIMKSILPKIIFFGTEKLSLIVLKKLVTSGYDILAVVTKPDQPSGRGRQIKQPAIKIFATNHNIPVWQPAKLSEITDKVHSLSEKPIGVLASYGKILPQETLDLFDPGIINLHPSLLPKYRGPSPIEAAILNNDDKTGVSIMLLQSKMDAGPIYSQKELHLTGQETKPELHDTLANIGADLIAEILPNIASGELSLQPQNEESATYCHLIKKEDGLIDPSITTAAQAERQVRAYLDYPKSKITVEGHTILILSANVAQESNSPLYVTCQDGQYLSVRSLIAPSGKTMSSEEFIRGYLS